jgi:hypothetical protein
MKMSFEKRVWQEMSHLNVNDKTSKKMNLTYLSWSDCWATLADYYPESNYEFGEPIYYNDETVEVSCVVTIKEGEHSFSRKMYLPVMDHRNNSVVNPSSRQISDARQRCLVKAVAVATGLGLYIYRGEDLPSEDKPKRINKQMVQQYVQQTLEALSAEDGLALRQLGDELRDDPDTNNAVWKLLDSNQQKAIKALIHSVKGEA